MKYVKIKASSFPGREYLFEANENIHKINFLFLNFKYIFDKIKNGGFPKGRYKRKSFWKNIDYQLEEKYSHYSLQGQQNKFPNN